MLTNCYDNQTTFGYKVNKKTLFIMCQPVTNIPTGILLFWDSDLDPDDILCWDIEDKKSQFNLTCKKLGRGWGRKFVTPLTQ